jgi:protein-disulfide isomerase
VPLQLEIDFLLGNPHQGSNSAPSAIVAFGNFECTPCRVFAQAVLPDILKAYVEPGTVRFALRYFSPDGQASAREAAEVTECAASFGRAWDVHNKLFAVAGPLSRTLLASTWESVGLDSLSLRRCLAAPPTVPILRDIKHARSIGVAVAPTFLIGSIRDGKLIVSSVLEGLHPFNDFVTAITGTGAGRTQKDY